MSTELGQPPRPSALVVMATTESSIKISWGYSSWGATGSRVTWGFEPLPEKTIGQQDLAENMHQYVITELNPNTKYYIFVRGTNAEGISGPRQVDGTTSPATSLPASPTRLNAVPSKDQMVLNWSGAANASCYKISHGMAPDGPIIDTVIRVAPPVTVRGLTSNTQYYFEVRSSNNRGDSAPARIVKQTLQVPAAPTDLQTTPGVITMDLTWGASTGASQFFIRYGFEPGGAPKTIGTTSKSYQLTGLSKNTLYFVEVTVANGNGESAPTRITKKTLDGPPIPGGTSTPQVAVSYDTVRLYWSHPGGASGYEISYGINDADRQVIGRQTTTHVSWLIKHLAFETTYFFEVRAFNESGSSQPSSTTARLGADQTQPRNLRNPGRTFSEVRLTWEQPVDKSYFLDYEITCTGRLPVYTAALEYIATGLIPETEYLFKVQPRRSEGPTALSATKNLVTHDQVPPTRPQALRLTPLTPDSATLSWQASEDNVGVTGYEVRRNGGAWVPVNGTNHTITGLVDGVIDTFEVRAKDAAGNLSRHSRLSRKFSQQKVPSAPTNLRVIPASGGE